MATPFKLAMHANDVILAYQNGASARSLAVEYNTSTSTVTGLLKRHGAMPTLKRGETDIRLFADQGRAIKLFQSGMPPNEIAKALPHRDTRWIYKVLKQRGVKLQPGKKLNYHPSERLLTKSAKTRERVGTMNKAEQYVFDQLRAAGLNPIPQLAFETKNIDLALQSHAVAIEVCCRGSLQKMRYKGWLVERIKQLGKSGWHLYVLIANDAADIAYNGIDDMLAWIEFSKRQKAVRRQYRMVRCPFDLIAAGCSDDDDLALILRPEKITKTAYRRNRS